MLKEKFFKDNIVGNGSIFASISKNDLQNMDFVVANYDWVEKFNEIGNRIDLEIKDLDSQVHFLSEARDRLLQKLMNRQITV